jgi:hypothetical protein
LVTLEAFHGRIWPGNRKRLLQSSRSLPPAEADYGSTESLAIVEYDPIVNGAEVPPPTKPVSLFKGLRKPV